MLSHSVLAIWLIAYSYKLNLWTFQTERKQRKLIDHILSHIHHLLLVMGGLRSSDSTMWPSMKMQWIVLVTQRLSITQIHPLEFSQYCDFSFSWTQVLYCADVAQCLDFSDREVTTSPWRNIVFLPKTNSREWDKRTYLEVSNSLVEGNGRK